MITQTLNIDEYDAYLERQKKYNENYMKVLSMSSIFFFTGGLVSLYFDMTIMSVILLAASIFFHHGSSQYLLLNEMLDTQWRLALLINRHTIDLDMLRREIKQARDGEAYQSDTV